MTNISKKKFGITKNGDKVFSYSLKNEKNMLVEIIDYGCTIVKCIVPDGKGNSIDVVLGYDTVQEYEEGSSFFGATIGRYANRIANGQFTLDGKDYQVAKNNGNNHLHGGVEGFHRKIWRADIDGESLIMRYRSVDGEEMYSGNLDIDVIFTLSKDNALKIEYRAITDKTTLCNLTNHSYFNLNGHHSGSIEDHKMQIFSSSYTKTNDESIPTGEIADVTNTPMDFRELTQIGKDINSTFDQVHYAGGFDSNWAIDGWDKSLKKVAFTVSDESGITLETYTTLPGIQFYSGNSMQNSAGKNGATYNRRNGFCLESQHYPNSINCPNFPQAVLNPDEEYNETTIYQFGII